MKHDFDTALDQCLLSMRGGMSVDECLARYPAYADELRPLLELALSVARAPTPPASSAARAAAEQRMLEALTRKQESLSRQHPIARRLGAFASALAAPRQRALRPVWQLALLGLLVLIVAGGGVTVVASGGTIPGDALYPVKLASQQLQLALTVNAAKQELLSDQFATQRRLDVQAALEAGQQTTAGFGGVLQQMDAGLWLVGGVPVQVLATTDIVGDPYLGAFVQVEGTLPGNGQLIAARLSVYSDSAPWSELTPTGMPEAEPAPTWTPSPTQTPAPADTVEPTETAPPTETPSPTRTLEPSDTPRPTETPEPLQTEAPEATEELHETPETEETEEATGSPEPEETEEHEETPVPSRTPDGTGTPSATYTPTEEPHD